jgi:hypothetical protein
MMWQCVDRSQQCVILAKKAPQQKTANFCFEKNPPFFLNPHSRDAHGSPAAVPLLFPACLTADQDDGHAALGEGGLEHMGMLGLQPRPYGHG